MTHQHIDYSGIDTGASARLADINNKLISTNEIFELYNYIRNHSDLDYEIVLDEIEKVLTGASLGKYFYHSLSIRELAFLIVNNRYQESLNQNGDGQVDVSGQFENKLLLLVSEHEGLPKKTMEIIQDTMKATPEKTFRLSSYIISFDANKQRNRRLYILEEETPGIKDPDIVSQAVFYIEKKLGNTISREIIDEFLESATEGFIDGLLHNQRIRTLENYLLSWCKLKDSLAKNKDVFINIDSNIIRDEPVPEKRIQLWLPAENFRNNFICINNIFVKRGIPFTRQYFETFLVEGHWYIVFSTYISDELIDPEFEDFIINALYSRSVLFKSDPVPVGEIKTILHTLKTSSLEDKLYLLTIMQQNKQKEYLIPMVAMLNDGNEVVQKKAFDLIRHYLFTPTADMKNDYYWATLYNIFAAATVPVVDDDKGHKRPLNHFELIRLIRFRDIYYEDYTEPETGEEFLFIRMNGIGIGKGGIRAHEHHVSFSGEGALSTNMLFKTLGLGIPLFTTGKGGILGVLGSGLARENVLKAYADFLYYRAGIGPLSDVPAGDVGIGADEIGVMHQRVTDNAFNDLGKLSRNDPELTSSEAMILKKNFGINIDDPALIQTLAKDKDLVENYTASAITGKPGTKGLKLRTGATARGLKEVLAVLKTYGTYHDASLWSSKQKVAEALGADEQYVTTANGNMKMLTVSIQGFGKVGAHFGRMMDEIGARIISVSNSSGTLVNKNGIRHIDRLFELCINGRFPLGNSPEDILEGAEFIKKNSIKPLTTVVDVTIPAALEEVISLDEKPGSDYVHARQVSCDYVLQGANGPVTPEAEEFLQNAGQISVPDILANSGGVLGSYLEWLNGLVNQFGYSKIYEWGFVHPVVHNLVEHYHPGAVNENIKEINIELYDYAFKFILRSATINTIRMSYANKIPLRTAYTALAIGMAAAEGRLLDDFHDKIQIMRERFSGSGAQ